ncbi:MAG: polysaccharide deacetylase family protein [Gemmatimonadaceae bacterium]
MRRLPPILCYHKIERRLELGVTRLSPRRFARQMERLARDGWHTAGLEQVAAAARGERPPGAREMAITFDDAYRGLREHAFPVLEALGFSATCFVITDYAGRLNRWDVAYGGRRFAHLAWRDMRRWQDRGISFASHTATHPRLTWLPEREVRSELERSRRDIAGALDVQTTALSYPFGAAGAREQRLARESGYGCGFVLSGGFSRENGESAALAISRLPVYMWSPPRPAVSILRGPERVAATIANRCAVGTTLWLERRRSRRSDGDAQTLVAGRV